MKKMFLGIDPGTQGAFVGIDVNGNVIYKALMPMDKVETKTKTATGKFKKKSVLNYEKVLNIFEEIEKYDVVITLEQLTGMFGPNAAVSNWSLGEQYVMLKAFILGCGF